MTEARTTLTAVDPRSAARIGAAVGVCLFAAWMVAAVLVYILLGATGVWDRVNGLAGDLFGSGGMGAGMYFGLATAVGVLEIVVAALAVPVGALVYNAVAGYVGGLRVTVTVPEDGDGDAEVAEDAVAAAAESGQDAEGAEGTEGTESTVAAEVKDAAASGWGQRTASADGGAHRAP